MKNPFKKVKQKAQSFVLKKMLNKKGVPQQQQDMLMGMMEKHPEIFEKISKEVEQKKKEGKSETVASMEVMRKYQSELQRLMMKR